MTISVITPIERAIDRTKLVLFQDFEASKWFKLGFCAWLAGFTDGGGSGANSINFDARAARNGAAWVEEHIPVVLLIVLMVLFVGALITALVSWLSARGTFMFLDGIVRNRGAVKEPWAEFRQRGNRLFMAKLVLGLSGFLLVVGAFAVGIGIAWEDIRDGRFEGAAVVGLIVGLIALLVPLFVVAVLNWTLRNLIAPTMYLHDVSVMAAWDLVKSDIVDRGWSPLALYFLMRVVIGFAIASISAMAVCLTCCLLAIPYIGTVVLLPLFVFERSYGLHFLEQFGERWRFFGADLQAPEPSA